MKRIALLAVLLFGSSSPTPALPLATDVHSTAAYAAAADPTEQKVVFNTKSKKYHCATCTWAKRCTKNCITTTLADAKARGGVPCKVCGGTCSER